MSLKSLGSRRGGLGSGHGCARALGRDGSSGQAGGLLPGGRTAWVQTPAQPCVKKGRGRSPGLQDSEPTTALVTRSHGARSPKWLLHTLS